MSYVPRPIEPGEYVATEQRPSVFKRVLWVGELWAMLEGSNGLPAPVPLDSLMRVEPADEPPRARGV